MKEALAAPEQNRIRARIQALVRDALKRGFILKPECCEACGRRAKLDAHHDDYAKPLAVRWLCRSCHLEWHAENGNALTLGLKTQIRHFARRWVQRPRSPDMLVTRASRPTKSEIVLQEGFPREVAEAFERFSDAIETTQEIADALRVDRAQMIEDLAELGVPYSVTAMLLGISRQRVDQIVRRAGREPKPAGRRKTGTQETEQDR